MERFDYVSLVVNERNSIFFDIKSLSDVPGPYDDDDQNSVSNNPHQPHRPHQPYEPHIPTHHPNEPYKVDLGGRATINCHIEREHKPTNWRRKDGGALPRSSILSGGSLIIEQADYDAQGFYECYVIEVDGPVPIADAEIIVVGKLLGSQNK